MGLGAVIARVVESTVDTLLLIKAEIYPNYTTETRAVQPPGYEGIPVDGENGVVIEIGGKGKTGFIGVYPTSELDPGEARIYARDGDGNIVSSVKCLSDGQVVINEGSNFAVRFNELETAFDQFKSDFNSFVNSTYNTHIHSTTATIDSGPPGVIAPTTSTGTPTSADVSPAKIDDVRVP